MKLTVKRIKLLKQQSISDKERLPRNFETIYKMLNLIALPLFERLETKSSELNNLFMDFEKKTQFKKQSQGNLF